MNENLSNNPERTNERSRLDDKGARIQQELETSANSQSLDFLKQEFEKKQRVFAERLEALRSKTDDLISTVAGNSVSDQPERREALENLLTSLNDFKEYASAEVKEWTEKYAGRTGFNEALRQAYTRSGEFYATVQQSFYKQGVPLPLVDLAFAESHWKPAIEHSGSGAVGILQFIPSTAKSYGLIVDPEHNIDERRDPERIGEIAGKYLRDLYEDYKSSPDAWLWALAAYNGAVNDINGVSKLTGQKTGDGYFQRFEGDFSKYMAHTRARYLQSKQYIDRYRNQSDTPEYKKQERLVAVFEERLAYVARLVAIRKALYESTDGLPAITKRTEQKEAIKADTVVIAKMGADSSLNENDFLYFKSEPNMVDIRNKLGVDLAELYRLNPSIIGYREVNGARQMVGPKKIKIPFGFRLRIPLKKIKSEKSIPVS